LPFDIRVIPEVPPPILDRENRNVDSIDDSPTGSKKSRVLALSAARIQDGASTGPSR
jgi:hypothetical protein